MNSTQSLFFIALLPPQEVQEVAHQIKQHFSQVYNSHAALKSPPHITLQAPFKWQTEQIANVIQILQDFTKLQTAIPITLSGFAAFKPRVIYIRVYQTEALLTIQKDLMNELAYKLNIVDLVGKTRPFSPHLTVASKDLSRENFYKAWPEFADRELFFEFIVPQLTLLKHNGKAWEIFQEFSFLG
jgi:2'-5' RNA ligase